MRRVLSAALLLAATLPAPALAAPSAPARQTLEERVQRAEDEIAIRRLLYDYHWALDNRDIEGYIALFARDGEWVNGSMVRHGPTEIRQLLEGLFHGAPKGLRHDSAEYTTNPDIHFVDKDHATATSRHLLMGRGADGHPVGKLAGLYQDRLVREDGRWKFQHRVDNVVMPSREEFMKAMQANGGRP